MNKKNLKPSILLLIGTLITVTVLTPIYYASPTSLPAHKPSKYTVNDYRNEAPNEDWNQTYGGTNIDVGHFGQQTSDNGYIISGYTRSYGNMSGRNLWLIKTDEYGTEEWNKTFGGNDDEEGYSVWQTTDGGYIVTGYTKSFGAGLNDVFLLKTDKNGTEEWNKTFGGSNDDEGCQVQQTTDGGYIIAGFTWSFAIGGADIWLIKTDAFGNEQWNKTIGSYSSDGAWSVQQTLDEGYIITGWTFSYGPGYLGNLWLIKTDNKGNETWNKVFGGTDADRGYFVQQTMDTGYIITGYTGSFGAGLYDVWLIKTDNSGYEEWNHTFGGTGRDYGNCVQQAKDGGYLITGYTLSYGSGSEDIWVIKTDASGNELYQKTYGGTAPDIGNTIQQTSDDGYIIIGYTLSYGAGIQDIWLIKIEGNISESTVTIDLNEHWNLISVPVDINWTASLLGENVTGCTTICRFNADSQTYTTHVVGIPYNDFPILDGVGYFVYVTGDSFLNVTGAIIESVNVSLHASWNLIGWYKGAGTNASSLGSMLHECTTLCRYDAGMGSYVTHVVGIPYNDFLITPGMGLFIYVTSDSYWTGEG